MTYAYDPELKDIIAFLPMPDMSDPPAVRKSINAFIKSVNKKLNFSHLDIQDVSVAADGACPSVNVRVYQTKKSNTDTKQAALLYLHGGGFVMGNLDTEHASAATLCEQLGIVVVSVDYRLAPEEPYPAGLNDCYAALHWLHKQSVSLNIDANRIGVIGVSAGGGLAAALALMLRDKKENKLCFQYLDMPELDDRLQTASMKRFHDTPLWNYPSAVLSWKYYLGSLHGKSDVPYLASPARATDLSHLPPAYISVMEFDPLRDEGINYAKQLMTDGVSVELHHFPGTFHGSAMVQTAAISKRQHAEKLDTLRKHLKILT